MDTLYILILVAVLVAIIAYMVKSHKGNPDSNFDWTTIEIKGLRYDKSRIKAAKKLKFNEVVHLMIIMSMMSMLLRFKILLAL